MLMPHVNVLVYAHRGDEARHEAYARWLESVIDDAAPFALSARRRVGFVRIVTHPRIVGIPLTQVTPTCCGDAAFGVDPRSVGEHP